MKHEMTQGSLIGSDLVHQHDAPCDVVPFAGRCLHCLQMHPQLSSRLGRLLVYHG